MFVGLLQAQAAFPGRMRKEMDRRQEFAVGKLSGDEPVHVIFPDQVGHTLDRRAGELRHDADVVILGGQDHRELQVALARRRERVGPLDGVGRHVSHGCEIARSGAKNLRQKSMQLNAQAAGNKCRGTTSRFGRPFIE